LYIGKPLRRREDIKFLTGTGRYVDDIQLPGVTYLVFVRSPHAHARIVNISTKDAAAMPGVLRIVTADDWRAAGNGNLKSSHSIAFSDGRPMNDIQRPMFASGKVCHVGTIVAAVVATSHNAALDAAEAVEVEYDPLPAVVDTARAVEPDAPVIHEKFGTNIVTEVVRGDRAATDAAFAQAAHVTSLTLVNNRVAAMPLEPLAYVAQHDPTRDITTLWATTQRPHNLRDSICKTLGIPQNKLHVIAPDIGGGFGVKGGTSPEVSVIVWMAREIGRPVKWTATRSEALQTETHGRDHVTKARMAFTADGRVLALEVDTIAALGGYLNTSAPGIPASAYAHAITGLYKTAALYFRVRCVYTNTVPVAAYRGSGRPEAAYVNERLFENGAREMGIDVVEMRRRNLIQASDFPYKTPGGRTYDCGNPPVLLDKLVALSKYEELRKEQAAARAKGVLMGIGLATFLDKSGTGPSRALGKGARGGGYESAHVRVHSDGKATVFLGTCGHGQSHEITFAAIAADHLGIPIEDISVVEGDTLAVQHGNGTWGSRSLSVGGSALFGACQRVMTKAKRIAAFVLECDEADLTYEDSFWGSAKTNKRLSFAEVANIAYSPGRLPKTDDYEPGLEATFFYDPLDLNDPLAMHLAVGVLDPETAKFRIREYYTTDDCGVIINPMVVEGQIQGGLAQGLGQAMMENIAYDPANGQLLSGSFMDYAMPRASHMPFVGHDFHETPAPSNPLGVKGGSESGTIGPTAAIGNALIDAVWHLGIRHIDLPFTSESIWKALEGANRRAEPLKHNAA
jgi:carbon-monoxide dehydrogenase large subunit